MRVLSMAAMALPATALLAMTLLAGCGQKGPLYFASQPAAKTAPAEQPAQHKPAASEQQQDTDHQQQNADGN